MPHWREHGHPIPVGWITFIIIFIHGNRLLQALKGAPMGPVRIGLSKPSGQVSSEATKSQSENSADHQEGRTGSTVPPCSTSTAPSDLATDTPTLSCSSVSLETFSPTPSVLTGGSPFEAFFFFCISLLSVVGFSNFSLCWSRSKKQQELKR